MGMTMKRSEKATHQEVLTGQRKVQYASPKLRAKAKAEGRSMEMPATEYRELRMGRGSKTQETAKAAHDERTRYPRITTRK